MFDFLPLASQDNNTITQEEEMTLWNDILGVLVGFAGLGACSLLRKFIIYNWPVSKLGMFLAWSPPIQVELGAYSAEFLLLRRLVEAEEGRLELEQDFLQPPLNAEPSGDELTSEAERLPGARR